MQTAGDIDVAVVESLLTERRDELRQSDAASTTEIPEDLWTQLKEFGYV